MKRRIIFVLQYVAYGLALAFAFLLLTTDDLSLRFNNGVDYRSEGSFNAAVARSAPAVVNIYASKVYEERIHPLFLDPFLRRFLGEPPATRQQRRNNSIGSGVIMNSRGFILTNAHVISDSNEIRVTLNDGRQAPAGIIGMDVDTDLAILKIDLPALPDIPIGDSSSLQVGDIVLAIGNPYNFGQTVTQGIVSATSRKRRGISFFDDFIQTDADINIGNSGGALINARGELVGINTAIVSSSGGSEGIGLATPINQALYVMQELVENGQVLRGWLGIEVQTLDPNIARMANLDNGGVWVSAIIKNSPADLAGLLPGDVLISINNIATSTPDQAIETVLSLKPGNKVTLDILRGWERQQLDTVIQQRPTSKMP